MPLAVGTTAVPILEPGTPAEVVVALDREMPDDGYDVSLLKPPALIDEGIAVTVASQTSTSVTVQVVAANGLTGDLVLSAICSY